ncbi:MAG: hypothetical protein C0516_02350 [Gemmatimonas sp.]|nr:hypothetical protein [Gemmatimonas sp.]
MARDYDDERLVVVEQGGGNGVGMLLLGLAIGAGAALLFAPASGRETRERISREARRAGRRVREVTDEFGERLADKAEDARAAVDRRVDRAKGAVNSRVQAVNDAVDAGREAAAEARRDIERAVADTKRAYSDARRAYTDRVRTDDVSTRARQEPPADEHPAEG